MKKLTYLLLPLLVLTACNKQEVVQEEVATPVPVVQTLDLSQAPTYQISEIGTLQAGQEVDLIAKAAGSISDLTVKLGDQVAANQSLATIGADRPNGAAQVNLDNAQLQLNNAQQNLGSAKANNLEAVVKAQVRVQSLNANLDKLYRNLNELQAQNANLQQSLELQQSTVQQGDQFSNTSYDNLIAQLSQAEQSQLQNVKTALDGVFVNLDSNVARVENMLDPDHTGYVIASNLPSGLNEADYFYQSDVANIYNNYRANLVFARGNYQAQLPLDETNVDLVVLEARQRVDELRMLLASTRELLNHTPTSDALPQTILDGYRASISAAEAATLGDLSKLDALAQAIANFKLDRENKLASAQNSQNSSASKVSEAQNALDKFYITSNAAVSDLLAQINQTQLDLAAAQSDLNTAARTAGIQNSAKELEINTLKNQVRLAENAVVDNKVSTPIEGTLSELAVENGDYVSPGTKIGKVIQADHLSVIFYLSESNAQKVTLGQTFTFHTTANTTQEWMGSITKIAPSADPTNKKVKVEGVIQGVSNQLLPQTFVTVTLDLSLMTFDPAKIYVPMNAVLFGQNENFVYTVENEMAVKKTVEIGAIFDDWVEVTQGLTKADIVIVEGQRSLPPEGGVKVNYGQALSNDQSPMTNDQSSDSAQDESTSNSQLPMTNDQPVGSTADQAQNSDQTTTTVIPNDNNIISPEDLLDVSTQATSSSGELYPLPDGTESLGTK